MAGILIDLGPLREVPAFRRLWAGNALSAVGGTMTALFSVPLQMYLLTHSSLQVGLLGLCIAIPTIAVGIIAGAVIDSVDRRRLALVGTVVLACLSGLLFLQALANFRQTWALYLLSAMIAAVGSLTAPAKRSFMPQLLGKERITAGASLQSLASQSAILAGPALAGVITAIWGLDVCYLFDALSFSFAIYGIARLPRLQSVPAEARGVAALVEGFRFIGAHRPILGVLLADSSAVLLAIPTALFPAINAHRFHGDPTTLGLMTTALAVGGLVSMALSGIFSRFQRQGLVMLVGGAGWGLGTIGLGLFHNFPMIFAALALAGASDSTAVVMRTSVIQRLTPDRLRGRVLGAEMSAGMGMAQLGNTRAGAVAAVSSPALAAISGGICCIAAAGLLALKFPGLISYRSEVDPAPT